MKMARMSSSLFVMILCLFLMVGMISPCVAKAQGQGHVLSEEQLKNTIQGIINWKKADNGSTPDGNLINAKFLDLAGTTPGDWFPIGLGRYGYPDDYQAYRAVIADKVSERYRSRGKLHAVKATEWHRISLAVLAMGGDPTRIGKNTDGTPINLIADGTYDRGKTMPLGRQGINGWIWGLIALDSLRYSIPAGAFYSRDEIITQILAQQLPDGGFALSGKTADPDITAMALQALSPYMNNDKTYTYTQKKSKQTVTRSVRQVVEESVQWLSGAQLENGDFASWGTVNAESTCQVIVALCCLGINPETDARFIKNGHTLVDGVLSYRMADGGFVHSRQYDADNPGSLPDKSNTMASEQALYTFVAVYRYRNGMRSLYDFRAEWSSSLRRQMDTVIHSIDALSSHPSSKAVKSAFSAYKAIPVGERSYIYNYPALVRAMTQVGVEDDSEDITKNTGGTTATGGTSSADSTSGSHTTTDETGLTVPSGGSTQEQEQEQAASAVQQEDDSPLQYFTLSDRKAADNLPQRLTTEQYAQVTALLDKVNHSDDFEGKDAYLKKLTEAKETIAGIQAEIDSLNQDILDKLYPFDSLSLKDKSTVDGIIKRYRALSDYDRQKINRWEDVVKSKTKIDNTLRGILIAVVMVIAAAGLTVFVIIRLKKRRLQKVRGMEELAAQYENEDRE